MPIKTSKRDGSKANMPTFPTEGGTWKRTTLARCKHDDLISTAPAGASSAVRIEMDKVQVLGSVCKGGRAVWLFVPNNDQEGDTTMATATDEKPAEAKADEPKAPKNLKREVRNAITESLAQGKSVAAVAKEHGLTVERVQEEQDKTNAAAQRKAELANRDMHRTQPVDPAFCSSAPVSADTAQRSRSKYVVETHSVGMPTDVWEVVAEVDDEVAAKRRCAGALARLSLDGSRIVRDGKVTHTPNSGGSGSSTSFSKGEHSGIWTRSSDGATVEKALSNGQIVWQITKAPDTALVGKTFARRTEAFEQLKASPTTA